MIEVYGDNFNAARRELPQLPIGNHVAGVSICYEVSFGEQVIDALPAADFLLTSSSDAMFLGTAEIEQHLQIARVRAIETGRWLARAGTVGVTAVVDEKGRVIERLPLEEQGVLHQQLQPMQGRTLYGWWGNWPVLGLFLLVSIAVFTRSNFRVNFN